MSAAVETFRLKLLSPANLSCWDQLNVNVCFTIALCYTFANKHLRNYFMDICHRERDCAKELVTPITYLASVGMEVVW